MDFVLHTVHGFIDSALAWTSPATKLGNAYALFFPPLPPLTERNIGPQVDRVFIVTGGYSGVGTEIASILYRAGGKVYIAGRDDAKAEEAIAHIKTLSPFSIKESGGELHYLKVSLDDLESVKSAAQEFLSKETRLDVLFNNAGVSNPPPGSISVQGHELQMAVNCLATYLFTELLSPLLVSTAKLSPTPGSVRVTFTSSITSDLSAQTGGMDIKDLKVAPTDQQKNYAISKTGNWFLADHYAKILGPQGVLSVALNPGNLKTALVRHMPRIIPIIVAPLLYHPKYGAYTNLWAGISPDLVIEDGGRHILPWGRFHECPRQDMLSAMKSVEDGGTGVAAQFIEHCERVTEQFR